MDDNETRAHLVEIKHALWSINAILRAMLEDDNETPQDLLEQEELEEEDIPQEENNATTKLRRRDNE